MRISKKVFIFGLWVLVAAMGLGWYQPCPSQAATEILGYELEGPSTEMVMQGEVVGNIFLADNGFISATMAFFVDDWMMNQPYSCVAIYEAELGIGPTNLIYSSIPQMTNLLWNYVSVPGINIIPGEYYFLCVQFSENDVLLKANPSLANPRYRRAGIFPTFFDPFGGIQIPDRTYSIYLMGEMNTPTSTTTFTQTMTPTATPTRTSTPTHTRTRTPTYTPTCTATPTYTSTPTFTRTPTYTPTYTPTHTSTVTPTYTVTPTWTRSPTPTSSASQTATPSITPTRTITASITMSPYVIGRDEVAVYPMPVKGPEAWFYYHIDAPAEVHIEVYTLLGERGETLTNHHDQGGYQRTRWNTENVAPGIYLYRMIIEDQQGKRDFGVRKIAVVKKK